MDQEDNLNSFNIETFYLGTFHCLAKFCHKLVSGTYLGMDSL